MKKEYFIKKFNNGEYTVDYAEHMAKQGYLFIMKSGGVVVDIVFFPDYIEEAI